MQEPLCSSKTVKRLIAIYPSFVEMSEAISTLSSQPLCFWYLLPSLLPSYHRETQISLKTRIGVFHYTAYLRGMGFQEFKLIPKELM